MVIVSIRSAMLKICLLVISKLLTILTVGYNRLQSSIALCCF